MGGSPGRQRWILVLVLLLGALGMMGAVLSQAWRVGGGRRPLASAVVAPADAPPVPTPPREGAKEAAAPAEPGPDGVPYGDRGLPRGESIRGRVTDSQGVPVADAVLVAAFKDTRGHPHALRLSPRVRSEEDGFFVLGPLERRAYWVLGAHEQKGVGYAPNVMPGAWVDLALAPPATVRGAVTVAGTGEPVAGATVVLRDWAFQHETTTDAEGKYVLAPLPATLNAWSGNQLVVAAAGFRRSERTGLLLASGQEYAIDFALAEGAALTGRVLDARTLAPVKGAVVAEGSEPWDKTAASGADGSYRLEHVDVAPNLVFHARADGYQPQQRQSAGTDTLDFELDASLVVEGRVLDPKDRPVKGGRVYLHRIRFSEGAPGEEQPQAYYPGPQQDVVTTDADGTFRFGNVVPGEVAVVAFHSDFAPGEKGPVVVPVGGPAPAPVEVTLKHGLTVEGVVRDSANEPIPSIRVQLSQWGGQIQGYQYLQNYVWSENPDAYTDEAGRFSLKGAVPGKHWLGAWDQTYGWTGTQIEGVEGQRITDVVISYAGSTISGVFLTADGQPVPGANVQARGPKNTPSRNRWHWTQTDGLGRFKLAGLEDGDYDLQAWTVFGQPEPLQDVPAGSAGVELRLGATQVLRGEVTSVLTGRPLDRFELHVQRASAKDAPRSRRGGWQWQGELRSPDGRFERPVEPGEYTVLAKAAGHAPLQVDGVIVEENVEPQPLFLRLDQGGGIQGTVADPEGKPIANAHVFARVHRAPGEPPDPADAIRGGRDVTDRKGRYFLQGLAPGTYLLALNLGTRGSAQALVVVPGAEMVTQELRLMPTGLVTLRAADEEGNPVAGVHFQFRDDQNQWLGWAPPTNEQGFTTSQPLRMGPAVVQAYHQKYETATVNVTVVSGKTVHADVALKKKPE